MTGSDEDRSDLWPRDGRPRLVHFMPWDLTVGGAQRMLDLWCSHDGRRWETHVLTTAARGPFAFSGAIVHTEVERSHVSRLLAALQPELLVHHEPTDSSRLSSTCPQVWIIHCTNSLRAAPPTHAAARVFSNFDSHLIHDGWRELRLEALPLGVDVGEFHPSDRSNAVPVCGVVGRLHEDKVPRSFVKALRAWQPGPWRIRFVGHGLDTGYQRFVIDELADLPWVEFLGDVPPHEMPEALRRLDAVLIPTDATHGETGSYAAIEAMATGLPVVARDLTGLRYNCGDLPFYALGDAELLDRLRALDRADLRSEAGAKGRQCVLSEHDVRTHVAVHSASFSAALRRDVSILMPVFDTPATYLAECWESIRAQTFREWELVLVDDGSTAAATVAEIDRIADDPRVVLIRLPQNQGIASALNVGLKRCRGELTARMDADDKMLPTRLARQVAYLRTHLDVSIVGAQSQAIDWETRQLHPPTSHPETVTDEFIERQFQTSEIWFLNHPTAMYRRRDVMNLGGYPAYRIAQDLGLWLKVVRTGLKIHNLPTVELHYRLHPRQISTANGVRRREYLQIVAQCWGEPAKEQDILA
jgi:glycosyltransferase involved in cell wall biosynthesis